MVIPMNKRLKVELIDIEKTSSGLLLEAKPSDTEKELVWKGKVVIGNGKWSEHIIYFDKRGALQVGDYWYITEDTIIGIEVS